MVKGTTTGTMSDADGKYSLDVPGPASVLEFSFVGFKSQDVTVGNQAMINVTLLADTESLDEVVFVGYGTQKKVTVTGSVSSVSGDDLKVSPTTNLSNGMLGRLPGVIGCVPMNRAVAEPRLESGEPTRLVARIHSSSSMEFRTAPAD